MTHSRILIENLVENLLSRLYRQDIWTDRRLSDSYIRNEISFIIIEIKSNYKNCTFYNK